MMIRGSGYFLGHPVCEKRIVGGRASPLYLEGGM